MHSQLRRLTVPVWIFLLKERLRIASRADVGIDPEKWPLRISALTEHVRGVRRRSRFTDMMTSSRAIRVCAKRADASPFAIHSRRLARPEADMVFSSRKMRLQIRLAPHFLPVSGSQRRRHRALMPAPFPNARRGRALPVRLLPA